MNVNNYNRETISKEILITWQNILNITADILGVVAGVITRLDGNIFEVFLTNENENNPYTVGFTSHYPDSGWYCEYTLKSKGLNHIKNASLAPEWKDNFAAVELGIISYTGIPINQPTGEQFGTVCFLDYKEQPHNELHIRLITQIKNTIELSLQFIQTKNEVKRRDQIIEDLSKIFPICSYCKKVREENDNWIPIEKYVQDTTGASASYGICPECYKIEKEKIRLHRINPGIRPR